MALHTLALGVLPLLPSTNRPLRLFLKENLASYFSAVHKFSHHITYGAKGGLTQERNNVGKVV